MDPLELLRALRRRWVVILAAVIIALVPAFLTSAKGPIHLGAPVPVYRATTVLLNTSSGSSTPGAITNLNTIAALATVGDVPVLAAKTLKFTGDPASLALGVTASADADKGIVSVSATSRDPSKAKQEADAFANAIIEFLNLRAQNAVALQIQTVTAQLDRLTAQVTAFDKQIASAKGSSAALLTAQRDATVRQYGALYEFYQQLSTPAGYGGTGLEVVQRATALPVVQTGIQAPRTRTSRLILGGIIGLLAGLALALILERLDRQIRTKQAAEEHFALPLLVAIPSMHAGLFRRRRVTPDRARSPATDAFQLLAAGIMHPPAETLDGSGNGSRTVPRTILVTSAGPGEGKSTVVAHLASAFAELGKTVLVLSCDFRRPAVHRILGVANDAGLADALRSPNGEPLLAKHIRATAFKEVRVVPSGSRRNGALRLLSSDAMRRAIDEARSEADIVLLDSSPILTSDAAPLLREVDAVLVVARAGKTTIEMAERTTELLRRLGAPVVGVAFNDVDEKILPHAYYGRGLFARSE